MFNESGRLGERTNTTAASAITAEFGTLDDIEQPYALLQYLRTTGRIAAHETPNITTLRGGVSNRTVLVERANGESWVLKQALAKLRVAVDWFCDPARIHREAQGLRTLMTLAPQGSITPLIFEDGAQHLFAMAAVPRPSENWKDMLLAGCVFPEHVLQFGSLLGTIHRRAFERRAELAAVFADRRFFESLRLEPYYAYTATRVPQSAPFYEKLLAETRAQQLTLVHGDYSPKNVLVAEGRLVLLDHEVIHWGDPAFDAGFALTHLLSKAHHLRERRNDYAEAASVFWSTYRDALGMVPWLAALESRVVANTAGCLLARVAGRSPLEYLSVSERAGQRRSIVAIMLGTMPSTVAAFVPSFLERL